MDNTDIDRRMADEISAAMAVSGISRQSMADQTGIPFTTLSRRLTRRGHGFTVTELVAICNVLGISLTELALRCERAVAAA